MNRRCRSPNCADYEYYGGRGIVVCAQWKSFEQFYADMGPRPSAKHTLDRIDNNGNYEPANCRWVTMTTQLRNTRRNKMVTAFGKTAPLSEFVMGGRPLKTKEDKAAYMAVYFKLRKGIPAEEAISSVVEYV